MDVVVLEDEGPAAAQLASAIAAWDPRAHVRAVVPSVREAVRLLRAGPEPDLLFCDVRLEDGDCFRVFDAVPLRCPVVFATAYDAHVVDALERNAIDYLLKPIEPARVAQALDKYARLREHFGGRLLDVAKSLAAPGSPRGPLTRIIARKGAAFVAVPTPDVAWLTTEHKLTLLVTREGARHVVDEPLSELEDRLDPSRFLRLSRRYLAQVDAVRSFRSAGKGRIEVELAPPPDGEVVVSQESAAAFRRWIGG